MELVQPAQVMAVVKADGYGHGAVEVARVALEAGARYLAVATTSEGIALRSAGIDAPILVLGVGGAAEPLDRLVEAGLTATITTEQAARRLDAAARSRGRRVRVHLKVDTGMGRLGVLPGQAAWLAGRVASLPAVELEGVYSHLATADDPDPSYVAIQAGRFRETVASVERELGARAPRPSPPGQHGRSALLL
ncbi:MAG: alanine racemase [Limnochordaceae bacterium]|nr:alanine racemase [Limnochordaceae bacterium]